MQTELRQIVTICGLTIGGAKMLETSAQVAAELSPPIQGLDGERGAGQAIAVAAGHGFSAGEFMAVFWADGSRSHCEVDSVSAEEIVLVTPTGVGDALPAENTILVVAKEVRYSAENMEHPIALLPTEPLTHLFVTSTVRASLYFADSVAASLGRMVLAAGSMAVAEYAALPIADVTEVWIACGETAGGLTIQLGGLYDAEA